MTRRRQSSWGTLFFLTGAKLSDPKRLLRGSGTKVRHIVVDDPEVLDQPSIKALTVEVAASARPPRSWLLSDESSYTTGAFIDVTGGK